MARPVAGRRFPLYALMSLSVWTVVTFPAEPSGQGDAAIA
jgi:hypothetical protein